jgi:hypothetical protein
MEETRLIIISLFAIIILTLMYEPPQITEGFLLEDIKREVENVLEEPVEDIIDITTREVNKARDETTKGFNVITDETTKGFNVVTDETTKGFNVVKKGTEQLLDEIEKGFNDIFREVKIIINYIVCGFNKIKTLPKCFFWYFLDIIYGIFYLFYSMLAFLIPPLKDGAKLLGEGIKMADEIVYDLTDIHINRYPEDVINMCYLCEPRKKKPDIPKKKKPKTPKKKCFT